MELKVAKPMLNFKVFNIQNIFGVISLLDRFLTDPVKIISIELTLLLRL